MNAKYVCKTSSGHVLIEANVLSSVDEVKAAAEKEHDVYVVDVVAEFPIGTPPSDMQEYAIPLKYRQLKKKKTENRK